jgi:hypothetical protein
LVPSQVGSQFEHKHDGIVVLVVEIEDVWRWNDK